MNADIDALHEQLAARAAYAAQLRSTLESADPNGAAVRDALAIEHLEAQLERVNVDRERALAEFSETVAHLKQRIAALRAKAADARVPASAPAKRKKKAPRKR
jgi:predicted  nucleic acid-binding Zn-ribbon protein